MVIPLNWWDFGEYRLTYDFDAYRELLRLLDSQLGSILRERQERWKEAASSAEEEAVRGELYSILYEEEERGEQLKSILFKEYPVQFVLRGVVRAVRA